MSAADSRLVLSLPPRTGSEPSAIRRDAERVASMSGPPCSARPRLRSSSLSRRRSRPRAYVDGSVRDLATSPSSLSKVSSWADIPTKPASSASVSWASISLISASEGWTVLAGGPVQPHHRGRGCRSGRRTPPGWVRGGATRAPRRTPRRCSTPGACAARRSRTGAGSPRPGRRGRRRSTGSTWIVDSEQEPTKIVVTPCRTDSTRSGPSSTSTS